MLHLFIASDPQALGRLDYDLLPDQTLVEMLFSGIPKDKQMKHFQNQDAEGYFKDVCEWECVRCDELKNVTEIEKTVTAYVQGTVTIDYMPPQVTKFKLVCDSMYNGGKLTGTLQTSLLPHKLDHFHITDLSFAGTVDLRTLPSVLREFDIHGNNFTGGCDLTALPSSIQRLKVDKNNFFGSISLESLPKGLKVLFLSKNNFFGKLNFGSLPDSLEVLDIKNNKFCGEFRLTKALRYGYFNAGNNDFDPRATLSKDLKNMYVILKSSPITHIVDEDGNTHPSSRFLLDS